MTSLTGGNTADNDIRKLMEQIIAERDAKFAPKQEGDEATPRGGMFDKPEVKANDGDVITDLLGYLEQKRTEALDSYQSKVMRSSTKPLPKPEDIDVSSFLSEAGLSSQPEPLTFTSDTAPALGEPSWLQVADNAFLDPSKEPAKPTLSEGLLSREDKPVEELTDDEKFLRTGKLPKKGLMSPRFDTKGETPSDSTSIIAAVRDADVTSNGTVDMNKVKDTVISSVGNNIYSAGLLGGIKTEVGSGVKDESPYYSVQAAYDAWTDSDVDDALDSLPAEQKARLLADKTSGTRTGGKASAADRKALGEAMFDKKYEGGKKYKGRGLIQITHKSTYKEVGNRLGIDLVKNPELVNDPKYAVPAAIAYLDYKGYFKLKPSEITKNKLQALINPNASTKVKNERWSFTEEFLKDIKDEGGAVSTSTRPKAR